jgi:hypothetical protein
MEVLYTVTCSCVGSHINSQCSWITSFCLGLNYYYDAFCQAFSLDFNLRSHMRTHTGEKYHACPFEDCGKRYAHEYKLRAHIRSYHDKVCYCVPLLLYVGSVHIYYICFWVLVDRLSIERLVHTKFLSVFFIGLHTFTCHNMLFLKPGELP